MIVVYLCTCLSILSLPKNALSLLISRNAPFFSRFNLCNNLSLSAFSFDCTLRFLVSYLKLLLINK